jgi:O-succinylbenzoate synthase
VGDAVSRGFQRIKLKMMPGWDANMLEAVRARFPSAVFHVDANCGYGLDDELWKTIDQYQLAMLEQPLGFDDVLQHSRLQQRVSTPVCLDESIKSLENAKAAIELGSCRFINLKPGRVGGVTVAKQIHDFTAECGVPCWVGGMLSSAGGAHSDIALAQLPNMLYPADIFPSDKFYELDLAVTPVTLVDIEGQGPSVVASGTTPEPDPERLVAVTVQRAFAEGPHGTR